MTTHTLTAPSSALPGLLHELVRLFRAMAAGMKAAHDYERYSSRTDAALAREGIGRQDISRMVFERNFRDRP